MHHPFCSVSRLIFKSLGIRCVPFLDQIVPYLLQVARKCGPGLRESLLQQLSLLTSIVHHNIAPFLPALFDIIRDYWSEHQEHILILGTGFHYLTFTLFNYLHLHFFVVIPTYSFSYFS
jgi:phosphatidylinositol kinase/protein kinase (PI-3  family)